MCLMDGVPVLEPGGVQGGGIDISTISVYQDLCIDCDIYTNELETVWNEGEEDLHVHQMDGFDENIHAFMVHSGDSDDGGDGGASMDAWRH